MLKHTSIFSILRRLAYTVGDVDKKIKAIPKKLNALANFIRNEPLDNYFSKSYTSIHSKKPLEIPLTLNEEAAKSFKEKTKEFPDLFNKGQAGMSEINFINTVGQNLIDIATVLNIFDIQEEEVSIESTLNKLFKIWGSKAQMNGKKQSMKYNNKSNKEARDSLLKNLERSADLIEKEIIPLLKDNDDKK